MTNGPSIFFILSLTFRTSGAYLRLKPTITGCFSSEWSFLTSSNSPRVMQRGFSTRAVLPALMAAASIGKWRLLGAVMTTRFVLGSPRASLYSHVLFSKRYRSATLVAWVGFEETTHLRLYSGLALMRGISVSLAKFPGPTTATLIFPDTGVATVAEGRVTLPVLT